MPRAQHPTLSHAGMMAAQPWKLSLPTQLQVLLLLGDQAETGNASLLVPLERFDLTEWRERVWVVSYF